MTSRAPKLYQKARDALEKAIADGVVSGEQRLTETWVATHFGISRAPARQALTELERMGVIRKSERRGYEIETAASEQHAETPLPQLYGQDARIHFLPSWELIYSEIENEVFARRAIASWRINEVALAKHYRVSRTVVRDVMARLQQRDIIQKDERGRWLAPALTEKYIDELYELRWVLEPLALEKAAPRLPPPVLERIYDNIATAAASASPVESARLDGLEQELHVELLAYCDNKALMRTISLPQALLTAHHFLYRWTSEIFATEPFLNEHLDVVSRIRSGDIAGAKESLTHHLKVSRERAMLRIHSVARKISPSALTYLEWQGDGYP